MKSTVCAALLLSIMFFAPATEQSVKAHEVSTRISAADSGIYSRKKASSKNYSQFSFPSITLSANAKEDDVKTTAEKNGAIINGFSFLYDEVIVYLGETTERVLDELGPESDYYEYASCAFEGSAKIFYYNGFELSTYLKSNEDKDRIYSIVFIDDSVSTTEGVYIGQTYEEMVSAYGDKYEEIPGSYIYEKEGTALSFSIEDNIIISISYYIVDIYS